MEIVDSIGVRVLPITTGFKKTLETELKKIDTKFEIDAKLHLDTRPARVEWELFKRDLENTRIRATATIRIDTGDTDRVLTRVNDRVKEVASSADRGSNSNHKLDLSFLKLGASVGATALKFGAMGAAIAPALTLLSSVSLAIQQMAPAALLLPGVLAAAATGMITLKVATAGFSDALKQMEDPEKFAEAVAKLAPSAREAAIAIRDMRPAFKELQAGLQDRLFKDFAEDLTKLGKVAIPAIRGSMNGLASQFNEVGRSLLQYARSSDSLLTVNVALQSVRGVVRNLGDGLVPIIEGFSAIARVGLQMLPSLTSGFGDLATRFKEWAQSAEATGQIERMIRSALAAFKDLGGVIKNVGSIISSVLQAATGSGDGLFATLREVTGQIATMLKSAEGQNALTLIFDSLKRLTDGLRPVLSAIGDALVKFVIPALAQLAPMVSVALSSLAPAFEPLGRALAALGPVIGALARQLSQVLVKALEALSPVIVALAPVVVQLIDLIGKTLGAALVQIAPLLASLAELLSGVLLTAIQAVTPILPVLIELFGQVAGIMANTLSAALPVLTELATTIGGALMNSISILAPEIPKIVQAFADLWLAVIPLLPVIVQLAAQVLPVLIAILPQLLPSLVALAQMFTEVLTAAMPLIQIIVSTLIPILTVMGQSAADVARAVTIALQGMFDFFAGTIKLIVGILTGDWAQAWEGAKQAVGGAIQAIGGILLTIVEVVAAPIRNAISGAVRLFTGAGGDFQSAVRGAINRIPEGLGDLGRLLLEAGKAVVNGLIEGIKSRIGDAVNTARSIVGKIRDFFPFSPAKVGPFSGRGYTLYSGRALAEDFAQGIRDRSYLAADATEGLMAQATMPDSSATLGELAGTMEHTFAVRTGSIGDSVASAVREGLAEAKFEIDPNGQFRVAARGALNNSRR